MQLSIIIINYNVKFFLEQCLASVIKACKNIEAEILVADNNSSDGSKEFFKDRFAVVKFTWLKENIGFAKANNIVLQQAAGEKVLFLNPDTILPEDCLEKCLHFFSTQNDLGVLGVKMIDGSGKYLSESKRGFPSVFTSFCKMSGLTRLFPNSKLLANYYLGHLPENKTNEVDVLAGAFMMINKKVLDTVGSFDESFFMYAEDIDLSYRIQKAGYRNYYFANSTIIHFKGESTQKETLQYFRLFYGAMLLFVKKHYGKAVPFFFSLLISVAIAAKSILAGIKKLFKKPNEAPKKKYAYSKTLVVSDADHFQNIQPGLQQYFSQLERVGDLKNIAPTTTTLILCEPTVSFEDVITLMQQRKLKFFIHAAGTKSIVGSRDKKSSGVGMPV